MHTPGEKKWKYPLTVPSRVNSELAGFDTLARSILFQRGMTTRSEAKAFLEGKPVGSLDPFSLRDMERAIGRLQDALRAGERIAVYGDYDTDGVTAVAIMIRALRDLGAEAIWYVPDRFKEGYGLNAQAVARLQEMGATLIITVDCGIRGLEPIDLANSLGMEVIVTDHHLPGPDLPEAVAIVDPNQAGDTHDFKQYAGAGLAYLLSLGLMRALGKPDPVQLLDLAAIGTVADVVSLQGPNRGLVKEGLEFLNQTEKPGLKALVEKSGFDLGALDASAIGYGLGPRLNAVGRISNARDAVELLLEEDLERALHIADHINQLNVQRRNITLEAEELIIADIEDQGELPYLIMAVDESFHEGVAGLVASRIADRYYRPTIVASPREQFIRASARSIPEYHITEALGRCEDLLVRFGGHRAAAGFTIASEDYQAVKHRLERYAREELAGIELSPSLEIDALVSLEQLSYDTLHFFDRLEPCGEGNPKPLLVAEGVGVLSKRRVGSSGAHLKLTLKQGTKVFDGIAFRQGGREADLGDRVDAAFYLERNTYQGVESLQLNIQDLHPRS